MFMMYKLVLSHDILVPKCYITTLNKKLDDNNEF